MPRHGYGVFGINGIFVHAPLTEAHALAVLEINRGDHQHGSCLDSRYASKAEDEQEIFAEIFYTY
jgi:hypothetical protein